MEDKKYYKKLYKLHQQNVALAFAILKNTEKICALVNGEKISSESLAFEYLEFETKHSNGGWNGEKVAFNYLYFDPDNQTNRPYSFQLTEDSNLAEIKVKLSI